MNKPLRDEVIDQVAHFASNAAIVIVFVVAFSLPVWGSAMIAASYTLLREAWQHRESKTCKEGCQRDIVFSFLGIIFGAIVVL